MRSKVIARALSHGFGFPSLDDATGGLRSGEVCLVACNGPLQRSWFSKTMALNAVRQPGKRVMVITCDEQQATPNTTFYESSADTVGILTSSIALHGSTAEVVTSGYLTRITVYGGTMIIPDMTKLQETNRVLHTGHSTVDILNAVIKTDGVDLLVINSLTALAGSIDPTKVSKTLKALKHMARSTNVPVIVCGSSKPDTHFLNSMLSIIHTVNVGSVSYLNGNQQVVELAICVCPQQILRLVWCRGKASGFVSKLDCGFSPLWVTPDELRIKDLPPELVEVVQQNRSREKPKSMVRYLQTPRPMWVTTNEDQDIPDFCDVREVNLWQVHQV